MTGRTIVILAFAATACLVAGARLLDAATPGTAGLGIVAIVAGTALAATSVAGAWRPPAPQREEDEPPMRPRPVQRATR